MVVWDFVGLIVVRVVVRVVVRIVVRVVVRVVMVGDGAVGMGHYLCHWLVEMQVLVVHVALAHLQPLGMDVQLLVVVPALSLHLVELVEQGGR